MVCVEAWEVVHPAPREEEDSPTILSPKGMQEEAGGEAETARKETMKIDNRRPLSCSSLSLSPLTPVGRNTEKVGEKGGIFRMVSLLPRRGNRYLLLIERGRTRRVPRFSLSHCFSLECRETRPLSTSLSIIDFSHH